MQQELREINTNKALGPYDPFMKILKTFSKCFALPLTEVFNESFQLKISPKIRKIYKVSRIPKSVPCTLAEDLRPIALTSALAKVQESFAVWWIYEDIKTMTEKFLIPSMVVYRDHRQSMPIND